MQITLEIDKAQVEEIWTNAFGTGGETMPWWTQVKFLEGDWDTPGVAELRIEDPDNPEPETTVTAVVTPRVLVEAAFKASDTCVDACTGRPFWALGRSLNWDSCVSDCVLQIAVLGKVVYG